MADKRSAIRALELYESAKDIRRDMELVRRADSCTMIVRGILSHSTISGPFDTKGIEPTRSGQFHERFVRLASEYLEYMYGIINAELERLGFDHAPDIDESVYQ